MVAMETDAIAKPSAPSHTDTVKKGNKWEEEEKEGKEEWDGNGKML